MLSRAALYKIVWDQDDRVNAEGGRTIWGCTPPTMLYSSSAPILPETYTFPFEMTAWAVAEVGQKDEHGRWRRRTEYGERWDGTGDVVDDLLWHRGGRK